MRHDDAIRLGVAYLRKVQDSDGGFAGLAGPDPTDFAAARRHPTIFFTALILESLADVAGTGPLRAKAAQFLLAHKSEEWSWNYWVRGASAGGWRNYPDDLDDTACALAALGHYNERLIDGAVLAAVAKHLTAAEQAPGGPYRTWLVNPGAASVWGDTDIAVNANIGYFLHTQRVRLPRLEAYIADAVEREKLTSPYYVGPVPTWYFLARWYWGNGREKLRRLVETALSAHNGAISPLQAALLVTSATRLEIEIEVIRPVVDWLLRTQHCGCWAAGALYYEPPVDGAPQYAGSAALTTALCLEALNAFRHYRPSRSPVPAGNVGNPPVFEPAVIPYVLRQTAAIPGADLRRRFRAQVRRLARNDNAGQITAMANMVAEAGRFKLDPESVCRLNAGSVYGWLAYTIYDDVMDGDTGPVLLGAANTALRLCQQNFGAAIPNDQEFSDEVSAAFMRIDSANTWEMVRATAPLRKGRLQITRIPDYGSYDQLAERSWGHVLAAVGVLRLASYAPDSDEIRHLREFFKHFLIARQLNDDAHDWEYDLAQGRLTAVVALLLQEVDAGRQLDVAVVRSELRLCYWSRVIPQVTALIGHHSAAARQALHECQVLRDTTAMERWIAPLEQSARQAMAGRAQTQRFLTVYARKTG